ncbi:DUF1129 family protein [Lacticaseibacillus yichunensis]|uniref:DUF1129 family protein n=1 Tax=Lacticaseibacillus yichunensis TaxID=2486015 RepID=A0ABW4CNX4_9LACO|nr:DUF1129 family protein [Lacticaseibacillus yichunensis]
MAEKDLNQEEPKTTPDAAPEDTASQTATQATPSDAATQDAPATETDTETDAPQTTAEVRAQLAEHEDAAKPAGRNASRAQKQAEKHAAAKEAEVADAALAEASVSEMLGQLTRKNDEYVFKLRRQMTDSALSDERQEQILKDILPEILTAQRKGQPATALYGPVSAKASALIYAPKPIKKAPLWLSMIDISLIFMAILALVNGVMMYFVKSKDAGTTQGIIPLLMMSITAGVIFAYYNDWSIRPKDQRPKFWLLILAGIVVFMVGSIISGVSALLPGPLTHGMPFWGYLIAAALSYGIHYLLKRRYHLPGLVGGALAATNRNAN